MIHSGKCSLTPSRPGIDSKNRRSTKHGSKLLSMLLCLPLLLSPAVMAQPESESPRLVTEAAAGSAASALLPDEEVLELVNINQASLKQLTSLPGIGPSKAQAIIDWRELNGDFSEIDQLVAVQGIGEKTLEQLRARLTL